MPIAVTLRLVCGRFAGVETWYSERAGDVQAGIKEGDDLANARAACLSSNAYVEGYRVFNTDVKFDVVNVTYANVANSGSPGLAGGLAALAATFADVQNTSLLAKVQGTQGGRARTGNRELFGVPDDVDQTNLLGQRIYVPSAVFLKGLKSYVVELKGAWNFRVLTISPRHVIQSYVIDGTPPGLLGVRADLAGDALFSVGKKVRIRGAIRQTTMLTVNGLWTISRIEAPVAPSTLSTVWLLSSSGYDPNGYNPNGTIEGIGYGYCPVATYTVQRPMGRKRGGRSGLPRGRSSVRSR